MNAQIRHIQKIGRYSFIVLIFLLTLTPMAWLLNRVAGAAPVTPPSAPEVTYAIRQVTQINQNDSGWFLSDLTVVDGRLYFRAYNGTYGTELWMHDPSVPTSTLIADIWPGPISQSLARMSMIGLDGRIYFQANDNITGQELLMYSPETVSTRLIAEIYRDNPAYNGASAMTILDNKLYFVVTTSMSHSELWVMEPRLPEKQDTQPISPK